MALALAQRHGAHALWDSAFESVAALSRPPYTLEVRETLMPADSAPILYVGTVADIQPLRGGALLFLAPKLGDFHNVHLQIFCPESLAQIALKAPRDRFSEVAVVSRITSVRRSRFIVSPEKVGGEEGAAEVELSLGTETPFLAEGDCRGIAPLPEGFEPVRSPAAP